jgi:quinol monooxygenase YgiN
VFENLQLRRLEYLLIIRVVAYHALPGRDVMAWMKRVAPVLRGEEGLRQVEFMRSTSDPSLWGAVEHYGSKEELEAYYRRREKRYKEMKDTWVDTSKPVHEHIYELLDI